MRIIPAHPCEVGIKFANEILSLATIYFCKSPTGLIINPFVFKGSNAIIFPINIFQLQIKFFKKVFLKTVLNVRLLYVLKTSHDKIYSRKFVFQKVIFTKILPSWGRRPRPPRSELGRTYKGVGRVGALLTPIPGNFSYFEK